MSEAAAPVITIDGPSGTGKGTICQLLAEHLGWHFLDSGALYRVLAYAALEKKISLSDSDALISVAQHLNLRFQVDLGKHSTVFLDNQEISGKIRTEECGAAASKIATHPDVRIALLARQRDFCQPPGLVTDGRDMGTVVFPQAYLKIYLYASVEERAARRYLQLKQSENDVSLAQVVDELSKRDARDSGRLHSPLKPAADAVQIDTTGQSIVQVFGNVLQLVEERM